MPENKQRIDAIVTLGLQLEDDGSPKLELLERVDKSAQLFRLLAANRAAPFLVMSGDHSAAASLVPPRTEAAVMRDYALSVGLPANRIIEETESLDTFGNALFTKRITEQQGWRRLMVVSTAYHLRIGEAAFRHIMGPGYDILPVASGDPLPTQDQISYERAAKLTVRNIVNSTQPGDDEAIQAALCEVTPAYKSLFGEPSLTTSLHPATHLERLRRNLLPQAA